MQLSLFSSCERAGVPPFIETVLSAGADLAISVSGGKDSDAMLRYLAKTYAASCWPGSAFALFCELGRIEWLGVNEHLRRLCASLDMPLVNLFPKRSMVDEWQHRYETILSKQADKPFWSSASARYCTDREKSQPANKFFRGSALSQSEKPFWSSAAARFCTKHEKTQPSDQLLRNYNFVVCAIGLRAEESSARAKKPRYQVRNDIASVWYKTPPKCKTADAKEAWAEQAYWRWLDAGQRGRFALSWHPIHHWSLEQVWQENGTSGDEVARRIRLYQSGDIEQAFAGFPCHWVYATGNTRLSCSLCVLGSTHDILNGAQHNPWTWAELALMEIVGGWGFQQSRWLSSLTDEVLKLSWHQRQHLHETLLQLDLIASINPVFLLSLLRCCELEQMLFWTDEAFSGILREISAYWKTEAESA